MADFDDLDDDGFAEGEPIPYFEERITVSGVVKKLREVGTSRGWKLAMDVRTREGYLLQGNVPKALIGVEDGDRIAFDARVYAYSNNRRVGIFERPTKAVTLEKQA